MRSICSLFLILGSFTMVKAQDGFSDILAAGVDAAAQFTSSYTEPAAQAFSYNLSAGWYDDARVLPQGKFNIVIRAQATLVPDDEKSFLLDPQDYERIIQNAYDRGNNLPAEISVAFSDGIIIPRLIGTVLGENAIDQVLVITSTDLATGIESIDSRINLPQGLENVGLDLIPSAFLQAGYGLGYGLEIKARFVPRTTIDNAEIAILGGAIQWQLTNLLDKNDKLPIELSVLAGYSALDAIYNFEDGAIVDGMNQRIETKAGSLTLSLIAGTDFKVLNFYGGFNFNAGTTATDLLGAYTVSSGNSIFPFQTTLKDPVSVKTDVSSALGTIGAKLTLGFFQVDASYTAGAFDTINGAVAFKF